MAIEQLCFLLTRQWRDTPDGLELVLWAAGPDGPVRAVVTGERAVCFVPHEARIDLGVLDDGRAERRALDLRTLDGRRVDALYFRHQRDLVAARGVLRGQGVHTFESDLKPADRFLMERFVTAGMVLRGEARQREGYVEFRDPSIRCAVADPSFRSLSIDIETDGLQGALFSIAASGTAGERAFVVSHRPVALDGVAVVHCADERALLGAFYRWLAAADPDLLLGWNVVGFDLHFLEQRSRALGVTFAVGRGSERAAVLEPSSANGLRVARVPGRVVLDGIELLRAGFWSFETFELEHVARTLLGRGKRIDERPDKVAEIRRLFAEDLEALVAYNLEDCRLVNDIFDAAHLVSFARRRSELTGLAMDRLGGSVAAFDNLYLPRLHRRGRVARDVGDFDSGPASPGGYVLDSEPGLYDNVLLLDFKSLYPSIIRTFRIDPLGLALPGDDPVPGFGGATFAREGAILPALIEELWAARDQAKAERDAALSQAVKILMNSFYGVLGAYGCRFHDWRLATSITRRGHDVIKRSRDVLEGEGHRVIYGDTDSLFVLLGSAWSTPKAFTEGERLAALLNRWWREHVEREYRLDSHLEIEFETHFLRFLMPTVRGEQTGSKKRYAGLVERGEEGRHIVFKGLESVRTDWTPLARRFQRELYRRVFVDEPFEDFVRDTLDALMRGALDEELVYRKRLRRPAEEYTRNVPPHVQAARKLGRPTRWVRYVITANGPEPVDGELPKPDYAHYRDRQLAPAADGILHFLDTSFDRIADGQMSIF